MADKAKIQELVQEAMAAEPGAGPFGDPDGLLATLTTTSDDDARLVEIRDQGVVVFTSCYVAEESERPSFYPEDLPFETRTATSVVWGPESGTLAVWPVPQPPSEATELASRLEEFEDLLEGSAFMESAEGLMEATPAERRSALKGFAESAGAELRAKALHLNELFASGSSTLADDVVKAVSAFHRDQGWAVSEEDSASAVSSARFTRGTEARSLTAVAAMGATTVMLRDVHSAS